MHDVICVNLYRTKKLIKSAKKRSNRSLPYLCIYSWICDVVFSSSNENMINGNCSFERILENFENIPEIRLSFVSICVLWISSVDADSANCLQCTPTFWHSQKGPKRVLKFLKGIAVCWSSPRFFQSPFPVSAALVVSREARRPGRSAEKVTFFDSLETFLRLILICLFDGW